MTKDRFIRAMRDTWQAIASDAEELLPKRGKERTECIVELIIDANRVQMYGGLNDEEYKVLCNQYRAGMPWIMEEFAHD